MEWPFLVGVGRGWRWHRLMTFVRLLPLCGATVFDNGCPSSFWAEDADVVCLLPWLEAVIPLLNNDKP